MTHKHENEDDDEETVYLVEVPTDFFATYCMDSGIYEVYEVNDRYVTLCFRDPAITDLFVNVYAQFNWYRITTHIRREEPITEWTEDYIKYRYALDMVFGQE